MVGVVNYLCGKRAASSARGVSVPERKLEFLSGNTAFILSNLCAIEANLVYNLILLRIKCQKALLFIFIM